MLSLRGKRKPFGHPSSVIIPQNQIMKKTIFKDARRYDIILVLFMLFITRLECCCVFLIYLYHKRSTGGSLRQAIARYDKERDVEASSSIGTRRM